MHDWKRGGWTVSGEECNSAAAKHSGWLDGNGSGLGGWALSSLETILSRVASLWRVWCAYCSHRIAPFLTVNSQTALTFLLVGLHVFGQGSPYMICLSCHEQNRVGWKMGSHLFLVWETLCRIFLNQTFFESYHKRLVGNFGKKR